MYQKAVKEIIAHKPKWKYDNSKYPTVSIVLEWNKKTNKFLYSPTFVELRDVLKLLIRIYGFEKVYKEVIDMSIWDVIEMGKCPCGGDLVDGRCEKCGLRVVIYEAD